MPFKRDLKPPSLQGPSRGDDVVAVKAAISRAGYWKWSDDFNDVYTDEFAMGSTALGHGVRGFQQANKLRVDGVFGKATYAVLLRAKVPTGREHAGELAFTRFYQQMYNGYDVSTPAERIMDKVYALCEELVQHEPTTHYTMDRPQEEITWDAPRYPIEFDCSSSVIAICKWAGVKHSPDPIDGYTGYGNTGTLLQGGFRITEKEVSKYTKDHVVLAFYHGRRTDHVVLVKSTTKVFSHGQESGPEWRDDINYRGEPFAIHVYNVV
jgi:Putative peptidoglycan binding domain